MALTDNDIKDKIEKDNKINSFYNDFLLFKDLEEELKIAPTKFESGKSKSQNYNTYIKPLKDKYEKQKKLLDNKKNELSKDPYIKKELNSFINNDEEMKKHFKPNDKDFYKKAERKIAEEKSKLEYILVDYGEDSDEYKLQKKKLDDFVAGYVIKKQDEIANDLEKRKEEAKKKGDYILAKDIASQEKEFLKNYIDFSEIKEIKGGGFDIGLIASGVGKLNVDINNLYSQFENLSSKNIEGNNVDENNLYQGNMNYLNRPSGGGSGGGYSSSTTTINIEDRPDRIQRSGSPADVNNYKKSVEDYEEKFGKLKQEEQELLELEKYDFQPSESVEHDNDTIGSLIDAGRGVMGMIGANKDIPEYQRGEMFSEAMGDAFDRRDQGLTPEEMSLRERQGEETYAYDIKNISRASGGSAGVFLGNMGSAAKRLYADKAQMATQNESVRRMNRQNFQGMALQDEQINRRIFEDDLNQVMMTKQAGAGLVQDAFNNIKERSDYNKQYGKGSIYDRYMNAKIADTEESRYARNFANKQRVKSLLFKNRVEQDKVRDELENYKVLDASNASSLIKERSGETLT